MFYISGSTVLKQESSANEVPHQQNQVESSLPKLDELVPVVLDRYLKSRDHNGLPVSAFTEDESEETRTWIREVAIDSRFTVLNDSIACNPHILRHEIDKEQVDLDSYNDSSLHHTVIFPSSDLLRSNVPGHQNITNPFSRELDLGKSQLEFYFFQSAVLEKYVSDPRFNVQYDGIRGSVGAEYTDDGKPVVGAAHDAYLKSFGKAILKSSRIPCICAILRDLQELNKYEQMHWEQHRIHEESLPHPDIYKNWILGDWGEYTSIEDAVFDEIKLVNQMCLAIGWPTLFRNDFEGNRPIEFYLLMRPTKRKFDRFIETSDKILSDNIQNSFFKNNPHRIDMKNDDGKDKGTILLLDEWLRKHFRTSDYSPVDEINLNMKSIRKLRNSSAHRIQQDEYDESIWADRLEYIKNIYQVVRNIRLMFACHKDGKSVEIPFYLVDGKFISFL